MSKTTGPLVLKPGDNCQLFAFIGSQVIAGAATASSDIDVAVFCRPEQLDAIESLLMGPELMADRGGAEEYGGDENGDGMTSYKVRSSEGKTWNYLVFDDLDYFWRFIDATTVCRFLGVRDKPARVAIFRLLTDGIRDGEQIEQIEVHAAQLGSPF